MRRPGWNATPEFGAGTRRENRTIRALGLLTRRVIRRVSRLFDETGDETGPRSVLPAKTVYQSELLTAVTESTGDAIIIRTLPGRITYANSQAERMFGWQPGELTGKSLQALRQHPVAGDAAVEDSITLMTAADRTTWRDEAVFFRRDGTPVMTECCHVRVLVDIETTGVVSTLRDITARRRAETALQDNEARLADLLGTIGLAKVLVRDPGDIIRFWSHGCESLYGWSAAEAVGQRLSVLLRTVAASDEIEAALLRDGEWSGVLAQTCRDGRSIVIAVRKVLQRDAHGAPKAVMESVAEVPVVGVPVVDVPVVDVPVVGLPVVDVPVVEMPMIPQAPAGVHPFNRDHEARASLQAASHEAAPGRAAHAERMQALGQLAGGIAHDFNNILQVVSGSAALIQRRQGDPVAINRFVQRIIDTANRGATITRRMLVFARRGKLEAEPADPAVMLEGLREICAYTLGPGIRMMVDCAPGLPRLLADKGQLETALVNLATNARDAMVAGGTLTLSAAVETVKPGDDYQTGHPAGLNPGAYLRLSVSDTGSGMDGVVLARVAEPFFTTKGIGEGTGLGLSMVKGFAEQSGGGFAVTSEPGIGTVASLWLPQADDAEFGGTEASGQDRTPVAGSRVLLVDDDHLVRETLAAQLEAEGHFVLSASCGDDALALLETSAVVDVLVTDLAMTGMNGLLLIQRAQTSRPRLPAVLLTGYVGDVPQAGEPGEASYVLMHKPVSGAQLADRIAMLPASMTGNPPPPATRFAMTLGA